MTTETIFNTPCPRTVGWFDREGQHPRPVHHGRTPEGHRLLDEIRDLGVTQSTAWHLAHKIRVARMPALDGVLDGEAEVDETFIGGKEGNKHANSPAGIRVATPTDAQGYGIQRLTQPAGIRGLS